MASARKMQVISKNGAVLRSGVELDSGHVADLEKGTVVTVEEVAMTADGKKERARVASPAGWTTLKMLVDADEEPQAWPEASSATVTGDSDSVTFEGLISRVRAREAAVGIEALDPTMTVSETGMLTLEARLASLGNGPGAARAEEGAVIFAGSPDANFGSSTMDAPLLITIADALQAAGWPTLRFNYRGIGASNGSFQASECGMDADAVLKLASTVAKKVVIVGFSFGAQATLKCIGSSLCSRYVALGWGATLGEFYPPFAEVVAKRCIDFKTALAQRPKLFVWGSRDGLTRSEVMRSLIASTPDKGKSSAEVVLEGGKHHLPGLEAECAAAVLQWLQGHVQGRKGN